MIELILPATEDELWDLGTADRRDDVLRGVRWERVDSWGRDNVVSRPTVGELIGAAAAAIRWGYSGEILYVSSTQVYCCGAEQDWFRWRAASGHPNPLPTLQGLVDMVVRYPKHWPRETYYDTMLNCLHALRLPGRVEEVTPAI